MIQNTFTCTFKGGTPLNLTGTVVMDIGTPIVGVAIAQGVLGFNVPDNQVGTGGQLTVTCDGATKPFTSRVATTCVHQSQITIIETVELGPSVSPFPPEVDPFLGPITPYDPDDPGGIVHTVLPPEALPLWNPQVRNIDVWRGDFGGVTTPLTPPLVPGCNTTPPNMWMSFLLPLYAGLTMPDGSDCIDYYMSQYVARGYTHLLLSRPDLVGSSMDIPTFVALCQHLKNTYGVYIAYWASGSSDPRDQTWDTIQGLFVPWINALMTGNAVDIVIVGEELNSWNIPGPSGLDTIINGVCGLTNPANIPTYLHFTSNVPAWPASGSFSDWWAQFLGTTAGYGKLRGLCWQGNQNDPAGTMGAHLWDSRRIIGAAGGYAFIIPAFELLQTNQLYGRASETDGRRRGYEMCCCTRDGLANIPPVAGSMDGLSYGDGKIM